MWSAQSGITAWRDARTALTSSTPRPTVRKICAWPAPIERSVGGGGGAAVGAGSGGSGGAGRSGMRAATTAATHERADADPVGAAEADDVDQPRRRGTGR